MSIVKSQTEIEKIKKSAEITTIAMKKVLENIKPEISTLTLDKIAENEVLKLGAKPSFKTVEKYPYTICATVNDEVVHGMPGKYLLKEGDIIGIDIGAMWQGYHSDMAETIPVGNVDQKVLNFLTIGKRALELAINEAREGNKVGDISSQMQSTVENAGYSVVRELTGHGVGKSLHEEPAIPCYGKKTTGADIKSGMTLAIEVIYTMGKPGITYKNDDGWTISTKDKSLGGLFERTVLITDGDPIVLTPLN